jgi:hypothetical protein
MNCSDFLRGLEETRDIEDLKKAFGEHLEQCPSCKEHLRVWERLHRDLVALSPDQAVIDRISQKNLDQISPPPIGRHLLTLGLIVGICGLILFLGYYFISAKPAGKQWPPEEKNQPAQLPHASPEASNILALIDGNFSLKKPTGETIQKMKTARIDSSLDKVILAEGDHCSVTFPPDRIVRISPPCEFSVPARGTLSVKQGDCSLSFRPSPKGYRVVLTTVILGVKGTTVRLKISESAEIIFIEEGVVDWESLSGNASGTMVTGNGIKILPSGIFPIEEIPDQKVEGPLTGPSPTSSENLPPPISPIASESPVGSSPAIVATPPAEIASATLSQPEESPDVPPNSPINSLEDEF